MADDIKLLQSLISQQQKVAAELSAAIKDNNLQETARLAKLAKNIENADAVQKDYNDSLKKYNDLIAKGETETDEFKKTQEKVIEATNNRVKAEENLIKTSEASIAKAKALSAENKELWQNTTLVGKIHKGLTSTLAQYVKTLGFAALGAKALGRIEDAAVLRQTILIKGYQDSQKSLAGTAKGVYEFEVAMRGAQATAARLGIDVGEVGKTMEQFSRIVGSDSPRALGALTEATLAVSKELGIDVADATDYVAKRMDKFGGSATGALISLHNLRKGAEDINKMFGATVIRGDDVSKTLIEIGRNETIYAMDQRAISNVLTDNIARLQSMGESYDQAFKKAKNFTDGLTDKAPKWMKILAGQDIAGEIGKSLNEATKKGIDFSATEMGKSLDAAKPGLSKKVAAIWADPTSSGYEKMLQIQEVTAGTTVGMKAMNDQVLALAKAQGGRLLIQKQFNLATIDEADAMIKSAQDYNKQLKDTDKVKANLASKDQKVVDAQIKALGLTKEEYAADTKDGALSNDKIQTLMRAKTLEEEATKSKTANLKLDGEAKKKAVEDLKARIEGKKKEMETASSGQKALLEQEKEALEVQLGDTLGKVDEQQLDVLTDIRDDARKRISTTPGGEIKGAVEQMSSPAGLLATGVASSVLTTLGGKLLLGKVLPKMPDIFKDGGGIVGKLLGRGGKAATEAGEVAASKGGGMLARGLEGALEIGGKSGFGKLAGKALPAFLKGGKAVPLLGTLIGAGFVLKDAISIAESALSGQGVSNLQMAHAGLDLASMVPVIGTAAAVADVGLSGAEAAGLVGGKKSPTDMPGTLANLSPSSASQGADAAAAASASSTATTAASGSQAAQPAGSTNAVTGQVGALQPDGSVMVKLVNFLDAVGQGMVMARSQVPRPSSK